MFIDYVDLVARKRRKLSDKMCDKCVADLMKFRESLNNGKELGHVLLEFNDFLKSAGYLIAHNLQFDKNVVEAEFLRVKMENSLNQKKQICTMLRTTEYCGLMNHHGSKWPKLSELYFKIFNKNFEGGHDAFEDIKATSKCFWELKKQGVL